MIIEKNNNILILVPALIIIGFFAKLNAIQFKDIESMFSSLTPFQDEIDLNFMNVEYSDDKISSMQWFDEDSVKHSKVFHYDNNENIFLISELRESTLVKEYYFSEHNITDRFINYLLGNGFIKYGDYNYITEVTYNQYNLPVLYLFKTINNQYIGHITNLYNQDNYLIRESWFHENKKLREFSQE